MKRGFGSPNYDRDRAREVQRAGNQALRASGKVHRFTREEAIANGRAGGEKRRQQLAAAKEEKQAA